MDRFLAYAKKQKNHEFYILFYAIFSLIKGKVSIKLITDYEGFKNSIDFCCRIWCVQLQ